MPFILQRRGGDRQIWIDGRGFPTPSRAAAQRFSSEAKAVAYLRSHHPEWQDAYEAVALSTDAGPDDSPSPPARAAA